MQPRPEPDRDRLEATADQAIAACGGDTRDAVKALILANEFWPRSGSQRPMCRADTRAATTTDDSRRTVIALRHGRTELFRGAAVCRQWTTSRPVDYP
jgi:hypothetical protein